MATKVTIPEYEATPLEAIPDIARSVRQSFRTNKTKNLEWRLVQLRKLYWSLDDLSDYLAEAILRDLRKSVYESMLTEIDFVKNDCMWMIKNLKSLAKEEKLGSPDVAITYSMLNFRIRKEPLGAVLIIGPYNYPLHLIVCPLIGAIAAGCTAVIKPSELAPATAMAFINLLKALDNNAYAVVNGGVPETSALLEEKWDKIFYTGSAQVGSIIAKKAAETLTPVCLELGGKNPAFVTKNADLALAARRLLWGKVLNAGQVCMSHNYILIDNSVVSAFIEHLNSAYKTFFPNGAKASPDLARIVNQRHFQRIKKLLDDTKGKIVMGGQVDESELFIEPTAVLVNSMDDSIMQEETFGPIFAIHPVFTLDQAIDIANSVHRTPLALYSFGSNAENARVLNEMTSGGATLNDSFFHGSVISAPFGGVGNSGWGAYRGRASFDVFSHARTIAQTPSWLDRFLRVRYMPYNWSDLRRLRLLSSPRPNFDRSGKVLRGAWIARLLGLGATGVKGAFLRWVLVIVAVLAAQLKKRA